jgi:Zn-dependent M16 (insulinase) family peptidase
MLKKNSANKINSMTGGISFETRTFEKDMDDYKFTPRFIVKAKALNNKSMTLAEIINEILMFTKFDEVERMQEVIREIKSRLEMQINSSGHIMASRRLESYFSPQGAYNELLGGISYFHFISGLEQTFDKNFSEIVERLKQTAYYIFNKNNAIFSFTAEKKSLNGANEIIGTIFDGMENLKKQADPISFNVQNLNEGLLTPSQIQYVAQGYNMNRKGYKYSGKLEVVSTVVRLDYLWNKVRVQGGAYGSMLNISRNGNVIFVSYRDPNLSETLDAYKGIPEYLQNFTADDRELTKYIIGTISKLDRHMTPEQKGEMGAARYLRKITNEMLQNERDEVLSTTVEDIKEHKALMNDILSENRICVLGGEAKIKSEKDKFDQLVEVFG